MTMLGVICEGCHGLFGAPGTKIPIYADFDPDESCMPTCTDPFGSYEHCHKCHKSIYIAWCCF